MFDCSFGGYNFIIINYGFLAFVCDDKETAIKILNTIMGTSLMLGIPAFAVREQKLADVEIDPNNLAIGGCSMAMSTLRTYLAESMLSRPYLIYDRRSVSKRKLKEVLSKSLKIFKYPGKTEFLIFLLEANTYLLNSEHSQAFTISWIIIENTFLVYGKTTCNSK
jgi:hypothetical protein